MPRKIDWEDQIGRRLRIRDLHVLFTVAQRGSMAKAAAQLGVSTPTISEVIASLEHVLGVRLLERSAQGVVPTAYGQALLKRILVVFDELKQGIKDIEYLADPTLGEVRVGCAAVHAAIILPQVVQRFAQAHPRAVVHHDDVSIPAAQLSGLQERRYDLVLTRLIRPLIEKESDLQVEVLFNDRTVLVAGAHTRWASRRKIDLVELAGEPWILSAPDTWSYTRVTEAFAAKGLPPPRASIVTLSTPLRAHLLANGPYIASFLTFSLQQVDRERHPIKVLPVDLPDRPSEFGIITLKNRTLSPVAERFIEYVRDFVRPMRKKAGAQVTLVRPSANR